MTVEEIRSMSETRPNSAFEKSITSRAITTTCCIAGGGPAGMMLGLLLARAGVDVVVLEKHADFLRDFRGDTIHPSTLEIMYELGLLDAFLKLPHQEARTLQAQVGDTTLTIADFTHLPTHAKFLAVMPQWDFLNFLAAEGARYPTFALRMKSSATGLIEEGGRVVGVTTTTPEGPLDIRADLVVGADGRHSTIREAAHLAVETLGAPMDVLWFRVSRRPGDNADTGGRFDAGRIFVMINRGEHWQCAYVIPKGSIEKVHERGLPAFQAEVAALMPAVADRVGEIAAWDDVKLLTVAVDRLTTWYRPGLLCIGDSAHAMSPIGGVGVNLAVQDAVAAANLLAAPLREKRLVDADLERVQKRRMLATRIVQGMQVLVQNRIVSPLLGREAKVTAPLPVRLFQRFPVLRRIPARLIGLGVRPEHVRTKAVAVRR
jgi:2-polyprenyl-6-methoxyphenol hydroxylase-like FAD-dependent oxidoreductase